MMEMTSQCMESQQVRLKSQYDPGELISTENVTHKSSPYEGKNIETSWDVSDVSKYADKTFNGYHRSDGKVGTANHWIFVPLVFCESRNLEMLKSALKKTLGYSFDDPYTSFAQDLKKAYEEGSNEDNLRELKSNKFTKQKNPLFENIDGLKFLDQCEKSHPHKNEQQQTQTTNSELINLQC